MEEIREAALAYYAHLPNKKKEQALQFFKSMDKDKDGRISLDEYVVFLRQRDAPEISNIGFFKELDEDGSGTLDFYEVMTLFYIIESGRCIFCNGCGIFLKGVYFTCVHCFSSTGAASYNLCCSCYRNKHFKHHDDAVFCDNYALLRLHSKKGKMDRKSSKKGKLKTAKNVLFVIGNIVLTVLSSS